MATKKLKVGDLFYIEAAKGKFVFGKVLFDVDKQYKSQENLQITDLINSSNKLKGWYSDCIVIEVYEGVYDTPESNLNRNILIKRAVCGVSGLKKYNWGVISNEDVDVREVSFTENIFPLESSVYLNLGELKFNISMSMKEYEDMNVVGAKIDIVSIAFICLNMQGFNDLLEEDYQKEKTMAMYDLMYHPAIRNKIYKELNLDPNKSYYELSKEMGFDLKRFYE